MAKVTFPYRGTSIDVVKSEIGLTNVNNTSDLEKPLSLATLDALRSKADSWKLGSLAYRNTISFSELISKPTTLSEAGITDKVATLVNGVIPASQLPSYVDDILEYATLTELQSASIESGARVSGKIYLVTDTGKTYRWSGSTYIDISSKVDSVNGRTGAVTITQSDIGLGNVSNTSDLDKPISTATASALNSKVTVVSGKGLSTNDYTDIDKRKLAELPSGWMFGALAFRNTINYSELLSVPTSFVPGIHTHAIGDVTDLQSKLDNKVTAITGKGLSTNDYTDSDKAKVSSIVPSWMLGALAFRNTVDYSELTGKPALGTLASKNTVTVADISVPTGTASGITYLRGDGSWSSITIPTYSIDSGSNGTISLTSSAGGTTTVSVKGLGTAAYTDSSSYVTSSAISGKIDTWMLGALAFRNTVNYSELGGTLPTHNHSTTSITDWDKLNAITAKNVYLDTSGAAPYLRGSTDTSSIVIAGGLGWTAHGAIIQLFGNESPVDINSKSTKNGINIYGGGTSALGTQGQCIIDNFTKVGINTTSPSEVLSVNGSVVAIGYKTPSGTSAEFLKADGTVDNSSYWKATTASTTYAPSIHAHTVSNISDISTKYMALTGGSFTGSITLPAGSYARFSANTANHEINGSASTNQLIITSNGNTNLSLDPSGNCSIRGSLSASSITNSSSVSVVYANDSRLSDSRTPTSHEHTFASLTNKPTSLSGYGITDSLVYKTGDTFTGTVGISPATGSSYLVNTRSSISTGEVGVQFRTTGSTTWYLYIPTNGTTFSMYYGGDKFSLDTSGNLSVTGTITSGTKLAILEGDSRLTDSRAPTTHSHLYAGSLTAGGAANSVANALSFSSTGNGNTASYDGAAARTLSYNSIGAFPAAGGTISGNTSVSGTLGVTGTFTSSASAIFSSDLTVSSGIFKVGTSTISGSVSGATSLAGTLAVAGDTTISSNLIFSGPVRKIYADFSATVHTNRTFFATNHANYADTRVCSAAKDGNDTASSGFMAYGKSSTSSGSSPYIYMVSKYDGSASITFGDIGNALSTSLAIGSPSTLNSIYILGEGNTNAGRVGIGITSPTELLDVNGSVKATGFKTTTASTGFLKANGTVDTTAYLSSVSGSNFASQTANYVLAAPNGSAGTPTFRALSSADLPTASTTVAGVVKLGSDTTQTITATAVSATSSRTYAIQGNSSNQMVVNVPWTDTTYSAATSSVAGLVKLGDNTTQSASAAPTGTTSGRTYPIQLNSSSQMVVNVPWTDTNSGGTITGVSASTTNQTIYGITIGASTTNNVTTLSLSGQLILPTTAPSGTNIGACYFDGTKFYVRVSATAWKSVTLV